MILALIAKSTPPLHYKTHVGEIPVSIENRAGSIRRGVDHTGTPWETKMQHAYGRIPWTVGMDKEAVDCFVGPHRHAPDVHIITTRKAPDFTEPDEQKVMLQFRTATHAKRAFLAHYDDPRYFGNILTMPLAEFQAKVRATLHRPGPIQAV